MPGRIEATQLLCAAPYGMAAIQMPAYEDLEPGAGPAGGLLADLQRDLAERHGVIRRDRPRFLMTEDLVEVGVAERDPRRLRVARGVLELAIVLRQKDLADIGNGGRGSS